MRRQVMENQGFLFRLNFILVNSLNKYMAATWRNMGVYKYHKYLGLYLRLCVIGSDEKVAHPEPNN